MRAFFFFRTYRYRENETYVVSYSYDGRVCALYARGARVTLVERLGSGGKKKSIYSYYYYYYFFFSRLPAYTSCRRLRPRCDRRTGMIALTRFASVRDDHCGGDDRRTREEIARGDRRRTKTRVSHARRVPATLAAERGRTATRRHFL